MSSSDDDEKDDSKTDYLNECEDYIKQVVKSHFKYYNNSRVTPQQFEDELKEDIVKVIIDFSQLPSIDFLLPLIKKFILPNGSTQQQFDFAEYILHKASNALQQKRYSTLIQNLEQKYKNEEKN